jgi:hypothetical protein
MANLEEALLNPASVFRNPTDVVNSQSHSREQKIQILKRWEYDARELQVADDEGMTAPKPPSVTLDNILAALRSLGAPADMESSAPTKQGGS